MKKLILFLALVGNSVLYAQNGLFIQPMLGVGVTDKSTGNSFVSYSNEETILNSYLFIGYRLNNFIFRTGVSDLKTGYAGKMPISPFGDQFSFYEYYIAIPLSIAYNISLSPHISLVPSVGYSFGFNTSYKLFHESEELPFSNGVRTGMGSGTNSFGTLELEADYKLNSRFTLCSAVEAQYLFPENLRYPEGTDPLHYYFNGHTCTFNAGVKYYFIHKHIESPKSKETNKQ